MSAHVYLGIDVGTGSARAGLFTPDGRLLAFAAREIQIWRPQADFVEQSSDDIWGRVCEAVRQVVAAAGVEPKQIRGIGFDATCSLVVLGADDAPLTVSPTGRDEQNIIVWMDHRAVDQTRRINATNHEVLRYVGGRISPEMQTPKLLWIKENLQRTWQRAARFLDLPDFLSFRATGDDTRSLCTTVCKWTYLGHESARSPGSVGRWDERFFRQIGLGELAEEDFRRVGTRIRPMGEPVGHGLTPRAADELGLSPGTPVAVAMIDAHAGGLGVLGAGLAGADIDRAQFETRLALIGGTSSCHMIASREARFVPGVWGPYFSAMIPGMWLTEGGQSATGALIDHVIHSHPRAAELGRSAAATGRSIYELLNERLEVMALEGGGIAALTRELHVLPYFHGNRSPRADPTLRGAVCGLTLSDSVDDLALKYLATIQAIAYGTRHIIEEMNRAGYQIRTILACGGGAKNSVFLQAHADATGCRIILPREPEAVLLGASILGAVAAGDFGSVIDAMAAMSGIGIAIEPAGGEVAQFHGAKYRVFLRMYEDSIAYRALMKPTAS